MIRLVSFLCTILAAAAIQAADMEGATRSLRGAHVNAGSRSDVQPVAGALPSLGSAGTTAGASVASGSSDAVSPGGFWRLAGYFAGAPAAGDADADGVPDAFDNCLDVANPSQLDADLDGYGNACDADYDNDGQVGGPDYALLGVAWGSFAGDAAYDPAIDANGDGVIGGPDLSVFASGYGEPPGPSGLACAGAVPCTP